MPPSAVFVEEQPPQPKIFYADHPFSYLIKKDDVIIFTGRVNNV